MAKYPQINDKLLLFGKFGANHVASINWGPGINNTERHHFLILGYQKALEILLDKSLNITNGNYFEMDLLVSPIIFSLRHFIELSLKDTIRNFNIALKINSPDEIGFKQTHDLNELFNDLKKILSTYKSRFSMDMSEEELMQNLLATENILKELNNYDQYSFSFRYPFKRESKSSGKIQESLPPMNIDLKNLKEVSTRLIAILDYLSTEADKFETKVWLKEQGVE
ncbi:hypothetical protein GALL_228310 [mine drainage metagenome]|uniref:HEPN domain-containing protein n=1 Tax=mine drainage metagenome TaxID=410659 RepID=A0A1J5RGA5_9ZZZZ